MLILTGLDFGWIEHLNNTGSSVCVLNSCNAKHSNFQISKSEDVLCEYLYMSILQPQLCSNVHYLLIWHALLEYCW